MKTKTKTYDATATRSGRWWAVEVHEMPKGHLALTQGRTLKEAEAMAREAIALLLAVPEASPALRLILPHVGSRSATRPACSDCRTSA